MKRFKPRRGCLFIAAQSPRPFLLFFCGPANSNNWHLSEVAPLWNWRGRRKTNATLPVRCSVYKQVTPGFGEEPTGAQKHFTATNCLCNS
jgi:hypothetical protein